MERPSFDRADYSIRDLQFCNGELSTLRVEKKKKREREKYQKKGAFVSFDIPGRIRDFEGRFLKG